MKLKINGETPNWWVEQNPKRISEWWNNLEWQDIKPPDDCLLIDAQCHIDKSMHFAADTVHAEWLYKMTKNIQDQISTGIQSEIINVVEVFL